jgi:hypothetical protein
VLRGQHRPQEEVMSELLIGYARVYAQDLTAQRDALDRLGVPSERITSTTG